MTTWLRPSLEEEAEEVQRTALELGLEPDKILSAAKDASLEILPEGLWSKTQNTDSFSVSTLEEVIRLARGYNKDFASILRGMASAVPAPIVLLRKGEPPYLIAGNTRLMVARVLGRTPKVLMVRL